jgi:hypothetical protein
LSADRKSVGNGGQQAGSNRRAGRARANKFSSRSPDSQLSVALSASLSCSERSTTLARLTMPRCGRNESCRRRINYPRPMPGRWRRHSPLN